MAGSLWCWALSGCFANLSPYLVGAMPTFRTAISSTTAVSLESIPSLVWLCLGSGCLPVLSRRARLRLSVVRQGVLLGQSSLSLCVFPGGPSSTLFSFGVDASPIVLVEVRGFMSLFCFFLPRAHASYKCPLRPEYTHTRVLRRFVARLFAVSSSLVSCYFPRVRGNAS